MKYGRNSRKKDDMVLPVEKSIKQSERSNCMNNTRSNNSSKQEFTLTIPKFCLTELVLPNKTLDEINTVVNAKRCWSKVFDEWGMQEILHQKKSILVNLYGESGTGKTMAAHAIAKELGKKLVCVNYAEIESKYVGETSKNLTAIFNYAALNDALLFFDEADAILSRRVTNMTSATDVSVNQTRSVMLLLMNEYQDFIIFATNFISNFDPAFMRRISVHVKFELPDLKCRKLLWEKYIPDKMPLVLPKYILSSRLAEQFEGISGGDISNAVLNAAFMAARHAEHRISEDYFERAVKSILASKTANQKKSNVTVTKKNVSEEYVKKQLGKETL